MPNDDDMPKIEVARVALRLLIIWKSSVRLWLAQCCNSFAFSGIVRDDTKYSALVSNIDAETLSHVSAIVFIPSASGKYKALSDQFIAEFEDSEHKKF